jgi:hypothetical protein
MVNWLARLMIFKRRFFRDLKKKKFEKEKKEKVGSLESMYYQLI